MKNSCDEKRMQQILATQKQAQLEQGVPGLRQRRQLLQCCIDRLVESHAALCESVSDEYSHRSEHLTLGDIQRDAGQFKP